MTNSSLRYGGLDVHKRVIEACLVDPAGQVVHRERFALNRRTLELFATKVLRPGDQVAFGGDYQLLGRGRRASSARGAGGGLQSDGYQSDRPSQGEDGQGGRLRAAAVAALRLSARGRGAGRSDAAIARTDGPSQCVGRTAGPRLDVKTWPHSPHSPP